MQADGDDGGRVGAHCFDMECQVNAPVHHDWPRLIEEIMAAGSMTPYKLATALGIRVNQLKRLTTEGREPKFTIGLTIVTLHDELTKRST